MFDLYSYLFPSESEFEALTHEQKANRASIAGCSAVLIGAIVGITLSIYGVTYLAKATCKVGFISNPLVINQTEVKKECSSGVFTN